MACAAYKASQHRVPEWYWGISAVLCAAEEASKRLAAVGFEKLSEKQTWVLRPGGRYYFTRNLSTIVAFAVGSKYEPGNGFHMIGAHTDRCAGVLHW